jgi:hypothetical protein
MPIYHCTTHCIVTGPTEDIHRFRRTIICASHEGEEPVFDFDRIIPRPQIIKEVVEDIDNTSQIDWGKQMIKIYLGVMILTGKPPDGPPSWLADALIQELGIERASRRSRAQVEKVAKEYPDAVVSARKALAAFQETGFYEPFLWSSRHWGTPRNSYWLEIEYEGDDLLSFHFGTVWSRPTKIFVKLGEVFPNLKFHLSTFADAAILRGRERPMAERQSSLWDRIDSEDRLAIARPIWELSFDTSFKALEQLGTSAVPKRTSKGRRLVAPVEG